MAVHSCEVTAGRSIDFYAELQPSDELVVSLHGAIPAGRPRYPSFRRVASLRDKTRALLAFSDPTLNLSDNEDFRIGWYLGGAGWDPQLAIASVVEQVAELVGARHIAFVGSSAGGYAALRMSSLFSGSLAFPQDPQTVIPLYYARAVDRYTVACWPGVVAESLWTSFPERFDMRELYAVRQPMNHIYYRQSVADVFHLERHAVPFMREFDVDSRGGEAPDGRHRFIVENPDVLGHGAITSAEFDRHYASAMEFWRGARG